MFRQCVACVLIHLTRFALTGSCCCKTFKSLAHTNMCCRQGLGAQGPAIITPWLMHWSYNSLALSLGYVPPMLGLCVALRKAIVTSLLTNFIAH